MSVKIFATGKTGTIGKCLPSNISEMNVDLRGEFEIPMEMRRSKPFSIIHLAAKVGENSVLEDINLAFKINVTSTRLLAKKCLNAGVKKFVYASTSHVYRRSLDLLGEDSPVEPLTHYAEQKRLAEVALIEVFKECPERLVIARVFSILDWGTPDLTLGGAISKLLNGTIDNLRAGLDVRDFLSPTMAAKILFEVTANSELTGTVNICTSKPISIATAATRMLMQAGRPELSEHIVLEHSSNPVILGDSHKLIGALPTLDLVWSPSAPPIE